MNINEFLIKRYRLSQEESILFLQEHEVLINGKKASQRENISKEDGLIIDGELIREQQLYSYYAYYKPRGIECTLNSAIKNNLADILPFEERLYPIGRLDKESEGLLILTNDGRLYKDIAQADRFKEKEYEVKVDSLLSEQALRHMEDGLVIKGRKTRPAAVQQTSPESFRIVLTQGINRQIRRMCYKLGYEVTELKRIRIAAVRLEKLEPGAYRKLSKEEIY
ncbi:MAG: ribosomal large subunit pseudouridine synthase [Cytophagaceae bacterium]|jgi:23S rRNA pseudouridine2604 synthase|nr:ribosomal large subunit pseudouridine synthase [Cytophagaceae bacterium]